MRTRRSRAFVERHRENVVMWAARLPARSLLGAALALLLIAAFSHGVLAARASVLCPDPTQIVAGLDAVVSMGAPGPLFWTSTDVTPIVAGDNDTPVPATFIVTSWAGAGRVLALGHDGLLTNNDLGLLDNRRFATQALEWLDVSHRRRLAVTTGHSEWYAANNSDSLRATMTARGWSATLMSGALDAARLSDVSVLLVGNAWNPITPAEQEAVRQFVAAGGGLLMLGLGWSWVPYHPGTTLDDYPMNQLASPFGIHWIDGSIDDPTDRYQGCTRFHTFYPNLVRPTGLSDAFDVLSTVGAGHAADLPAALAADPDLRGLYTRAHQFVVLPERVYALDSPERQALYAEYRDVLAASGPWFRRESAYDKATRSTMAWLRERAARTLADAAPLTPERVAEIASTLGLWGAYSHLWSEHHLLILDNLGMNAANLAHVDALMDSIPATMHNLRSISVRDYLGETDPPVSMDGVGAGGVNVFAADIGANCEDEFPPDAPERGWADLFCVVVAHEVNHVVDAWLTSTQPWFRAFRDTCLARAGEDPMHYLRTMGETEFFAGTANQWFTDSWLTVRLGICRCQAGIPWPIDQAYLFVTAFSNGDPFTRFYHDDPQGHFTMERAPVGRDGLGRITDLWHGTDHVHFVLDALGHAVGVNVGTGAVPVSVVAARPNLAVFPNPARDGAWVRLSGITAAGARVTLHDCAGRRVRTLALDAAAPAWLSRRAEDGSRIPSGLYFARTTAGGRTLVAKVVLVD
jgi:hypothetical protein